MKLFLTFCLSLAVTAVRAGAPASLLSSERSGSNVQNRPGPRNVRLAPGVPELPNVGTIWVSPNGDDVTVYTKPEYALTNAPVGSTIVVAPGNYTNTGNLLRDGVNWNWMPGSHIWNMDPGTGKGEGIFDDRYIGAVTSSILGQATFYLHAGTNPSPNFNYAGNQRCQGILNITNPASDVTFQAKTLGWTYFAGLLNNGAIHISDCRLVTAEIDEILDPSNRAPLAIGTDDLDDTIYVDPISAGIWWGLGETHIRCRRNAPTGYGIYASEPAGNHVANLWYEGDFLESKIYAASTSPGYRTWIRLKWLESNYSDAAIYFGGRHYLDSLKISSSGACVGATDNAEVWVTAQKLSSSQEWLANYLASIGGGTIHAQVAQFEDAGRNDVRPGFRIAAGETYVSGLSARITNLTPVIVCSGGKGVFKDLTLACLSNAVAFKSGGQLEFHDCTLIAASVGRAATNAIAAATPQTVGIYGHVMANRSNSPSITLSPLGAFTVDANVK